MREEALKFILHNSFEDYEKHSVVMFIEKVVELKNKIYDDFESRVCKNCKWFEFKKEERFWDEELIGYCKKSELWNGVYKRIEIDDFGCNRFERRENERD